MWWFCIRPLKEGGNLQALIGLKKYQTDFSGISLLSIIELGRRWTIFRWLFFSLSILEFIATHTGGIYFSCRYSSFNRLRKIRFSQQKATNRLQKLSRDFPLSRSGESVRKTLIPSTSLDSLYSSSIMSIAFTLVILTSQVTLWIITRKRKVARKEWYRRRCSYTNLPTASVFVFGQAGWTTINRQCSLVWFLSIPRSVLSRRILRLEISYSRHGI